MKLEQFAYSVADRTLKLLETDHHYKVPEHVRKDILDKISQEIDDLVAGQPSVQST